MKAGEDRLAEVEASWNAAAREWDAQGLTANYAEDAVLFGGRQDHSVGRVAIRGYFASYNGVIRSARLALYEQELRMLGESTLMAQGFGRFEFELASSQKTSSLFRTSWLIGWSNGPALIGMHHFSAVPDVPPLGD